MRNFVFDGDNFGPKLLTELSNHYGTVGFMEYKRKFYMTLENYTGESGMEISEEFYEAAIKEFKNTKESK